jgi:hypothetical protein
VVAVVAALVNVHGGSDLAIVEGLKMREMKAAG